MSSPSGREFRRPPAPPPAPAAGVHRGRRAAISLAIFGLAVLALGSIWFASSYLTGIPQIGDQKALWAVRRSPGITFLDRNGRVIATRGAKYGARVSLAQLPAYVPRAFLAAEDRRFYSHGPVDLRAIARAARRDLIEGRPAEGGSTLSQQLARTLFLNSDPTLKRKIQEAVLAARLEHALGKDRVLELYLNRTYFGAGAYGIDAAARTYFGKDAWALSLPEAAALAALPNAPTRLALTHGLPDAWVRARKVLAVMRQEGWITPGEETQALANPPVVAATGGAGEGDFGYALDEAAAEAAAAVTAATGGSAADLVVRLTLDSRLQTIASKDVRRIVLAQGVRRGASQGALVSLAPDGAILAMVGGLDHDRSPFNRATQARRQPGSAFKVFVYGAAMESGDRPTDVRDDAPISLGSWTPTDYGGRYAGRVTLAEALARSINTVAVRLTLEEGPDRVAAFARRCGVVGLPPDPGPSIGLGAYEVTLLNLAGAYQVFQDGGGRTSPYLISEISTTSGDVLYLRPPSAPAPVYDPLYASRMVRMMKGVITSGTGVAANIGRPAAGKTGTSQNWRDAWFIGFTPDLLTAVWVGADDDRPTRGVTGGELPAQIWHAVMTAAEASRPPSDFPWLVSEPAPLPDLTGMTDGAAADPEVQGPGGASGGAQGVVLDEPPPGPDDGAPPADAYPPDRSMGDRSMADQGPADEGGYADAQNAPPPYRRRHRYADEGGPPPDEPPWRDSGPPPRGPPPDDYGPPEPYDQGPPPPDDRPYS